MVVIRKDDKIVVYFNSKNNPNANVETPDPKAIDDEPKYDEAVFREWQKNLIQHSLEKFQRMSESLLEDKNQKDIREKLNSEQIHINVK